MTETRAPACVIDCFRSPNAFIVATAMLNRSEHRRNALFRLETN
jgi:hypothetical protein